MAGADQIVIQFAAIDVFDGGEAIRTTPPITRCPGEEVDRNAGRGRGIEILNTVRPKPAINTVIASIAAEGFVENIAKQRVIAAGAAHIFDTDQGIRTATAIACAPGDKIDADRLA